MPALKRELAAAVLVEAAYRGDREAAKRHGVSERSVRNWRHRLNSDPALAALFQEKRLAAEADWADELPAAIRAAIDYLRRAATDANPKDPQVIYAVAGALKILSEVGMTREVLNARLAAQNRNDHAAH